MKKTHKPKKFSKENEDIKFAKLLRDKTSPKTSYKDEDLRDFDVAQGVNLTIEDFDANEEIRNPRAPCVVTALDPDYIKDARQQRRIKKFRMKTDILRLREITRTKFMIHSTQEGFLDKKREVEHNEREYKRIVDFLKFAKESLNKIETEAFADMMKTNQELEELKELKLAEELKEVEDQHQQILMAVQETYRRFLYYIKLISYFDDIRDYSTQVSEMEKEDVRKLQKPPEITELFCCNRNEINAEQFEILKQYIDKIIKPYLTRKNHMNADLWIQGFECRRQKIFNYIRHFNRVALLNHILTIISVKFEKTYARRISRQPCLRDPDFIKKRAEDLKLRVHKIFDNFEKTYKKDKILHKLNGIIPVILEEIENTIEQKSSGETKQKQTTCDAQNNILVKTEKIHAILMDLLRELDRIPSKTRKRIEDQVRKRVRLEKERSRRALTAQIRMQNWVAHFKKHELQKTESK